MYTAIQQSEPRCSVEPLTVRSALTEGSPQLLQRTFGSLEELRDFDRMLACRGESAWGRIYLCNIVCVHNSGPVLKQTKKYDGEKLETRSVLKAEDASCSCSTRDETGSLCESPGEPSLDAVRRSSRLHLNI